MHIIYPLWVIFQIFYWQKITNTNEYHLTISIYGPARDYIGKYERSYSSHINRLKWLLLVI